MLPALALFALTTLRVGPNQSFATIVEAVRAAKAGDRIIVSAGTYRQVAVLVDKPDLTISAEGNVKLDGGGFDYSGIGSIPRAIFQVQPSASNTHISGFELSGAHNSSHNGAGVRVYGANNVVISNCHIHGNDMGIMSNEVQGQLKTCSNLHITDCEINSNGDKADPGYNHNLYLGGDSVYINRCDIHHSLTGHNVKSRAHYTEVRLSHIHDSANREFDFVESAETVPAFSNAAILGCVVSKDPACNGNRGTIHFGVEKGIRNGTLFLINNEISSPFATPLVHISSTASSVSFFKNDLSLDPATALVDGNDVLSGSYNSRKPGAGKGSDAVALPKQFFSPFPERVKQATYVDGDGVTRSFDPNSRYAVP